MGKQSEHGISWTDETWNPIRGCTRVSEGCRNCYAERVAARFSGPGMPYEGLARMTPSGPRWTGKVSVVEEHLNDPLRWKRPRMVFVNSMSDLFHEALPIDAIERIFRVMLSAPAHRFQVLTKRPERMAEVVPALYARIYGSAWPEHVRLAPWIWLGTSIEDQATADERIPHLLHTPAPIRFVSAEPLLGPVDLSRYLGGGYMRVRDGAVEPMNVPLKPIRWLIVGGESGPGARPMHPEWARSLRDQCQAAGVAFFFKQAGSVLASEWGCSDRKGATLEELPPALRVREFPFPNRRETDERWLEYLPEHIDPVDAARGRRDER